MGSSDFAVNKRLTFLRSNPLSHLSIATKKQKVVQYESIYKHL